MLFSWPMAETANLSVSPIASSFEWRYLGKYPWTVHVRQAHWWDNITVMIRKGKYNDSLESILAFELFTV
jgi:hypothetical protein